MTAPDSSIMIRSALHPIVGEPDCYIKRALAPDESPRGLPDINPEAHVSYFAESWLEQHRIHTPPRGPIAGAGAPSKTPDSAPEETLRKVVEGIRLVRHEEFVQSLQATTRSAREQLAPIYARHELTEAADSVVLVEKEKSNQWVAELALEHCGFNAGIYMRLGNKDAHNFLSYLETNPTYKRRLENKVVVLFDDASFSGKQLHDHVKAIQEIADLKILAIAVVAPFMTARAAERISGLSNKKCPVILGAFNPITTLEELPSLDDDDKELISNLWSYKREDLSSLGLTWFSHKVPNYQSFPQELARGSIYTGRGRCLTFAQQFIPNIISPYRRTEDGDPLKVESFMPKMLRLTDDEETPNIEIQRVISISDMTKHILRKKEEKGHILIFSDIDDTLISKASKDLVERETTLESIRALQEKYPVFGCTARPVLEAQRTICELSSKGIQLGKGTKSITLDSVTALGESGSYFYKGIVYAPPGSSSGKGVAVRYMLSTSPAQSVRHVYMIDDKEAELTKVAETCNDAGVHFTGFHLKA